MDTLTEKTGTSANVKYWHQFHAEAHALSGELKAPIKQVIEPHVPIELNDERGGHLTRITEEVSIEGLISFRAAHTRVSGSKSLKHEAWVTLSTSILEGLNVFEIITADRVVSQVSTEHAFVDGHVPRVTFLGTKFENLQVCGIPVTVHYNFGVCGDKPDRDQSYLTNKDFVTDTLNRVDRIHKSGYLFGAAEKQYDERLQSIKQHQKKEGRSITCSLVESIDIRNVKKQIPGVETIENVIVIRDFGTVSLGEIEVGLEAPKPSNHSRRREAEATNGHPMMSNYFQVTMLNMELGCVGTGSVKIGASKTNGTTNP
jgi:hypothetical protein